MAGLLSYFVTSLLYALLAAYFWRTHWRNTGQATTLSTTKSQLSEKAAILLPLLLHSFLLYQSIWSDQGLNLGVGNAVSAIVWLAVLIYWVASFRYNLEGLQTLILGVACASVLLPIALPVAHKVPYTQLPVFKAHLLVALLAYSLFTIAALHALLMALVERRLHGGVTMFASLPPLLTMENLLFRIIAAGFLLLTLTLASGILFSEELFNKPLRFNHKTLFALISWAIFAALLIGRKIYGWRGRVAIRWTLSGFAALLLAYVGSKFILENILHR